MGTDTHWTFSGCLIGADAHSNDTIFSRFYGNFFGVFCAHPTLCKSCGNCHVMVVSDRCRAETGYWTHKIHPLLIARAEHRACCNMHRVKYLFRLLRWCWRFACWEDVQQATLEDAAIHSRHGSACILRLCKLHIPNAS